MDRRDFLKSAGMGAAALGVAACAPKAAEQVAAEAARHDGRGVDDGSGHDCLSSMRFLSFSLRCRRFSSRL